MTKMFTSREFNQDTGRAKRAAENGPVFITDRGRASHVLMTMEEYERLKGPKQSWVEKLGDPEAAEIEFDIERDRTLGFRSLDLD